MQFSPNGSPKILVLGDVNKLLKFEGYQLCEKIFYRYQYHPFWDVENYILLLLSSYGSSTTATSCVT